MVIRNRTRSRSSARDRVAQTNDYSLAVTCDQLKHTVQGVSEVVINTAGGNDTVLLTGHWTFRGDVPQISPGVRSISIKTGGGDDEVKFIDFDSQQLNGIISGPHIAIDTGNGNDLAWFRPIFHPPTLFAGLDLSVRTGGGDDNVMVENLAFAAPSADAPASRVAIDTAGGDDVVTLDNWVSVAGISGPEESLPGGGMSLAVATGAGRDTFAFIDSFFASDISPTVQVDLGGGDDTATMYDNQFGGGLVQKVIGGDGNDLALFSCDAIAGLFDAFVDLGRGDDAVQLMGNTFGGPAN